MKIAIKKALIPFLILLGITIYSSSQCTYSICLYDTYGDGWDSGSVTVTVAGSNVVSAATLSSGSGPACYNFTVYEGQSISVNYTAGSWGNENYYQVYNSSGGGGSMIYGSTSGSEPPSSQSITNSCIDGGGGTSDCTHSICLYDTYGDSWNGGSVTVNVGGTNVVNAATVSSGYGPACYNFDVTDGEAITITYSAGSYSSENYYQIFSSEDGGGSSLYNSGSGSTPPTSQSVTANCSGGTPPSTDCLGALPFCTSDSYTFPASTNVADMGSVGCLYTTPNPAWYWMEIGDAGSIDIDMSSGGDVDFIAWGPFTSLTAACASDLMSDSGIDCSYSTAATETANIASAQTGEVYVLLITNYANIETNISFSQTSGAGSTNCGIIAPPITNNGPLCEGETLQLSVSNPTAGATYSWSGPNSWTSTAMYPTISGVTSANDGTYSLVITVGSDTSDPVTTDVVISPNTNPIFDSGGTYCSGEYISALPTTSNNSITGTWSPAINNTATTTYTFTPTTGQCAFTTTNDITITPNTNPTFNAVGPYCSGESISALPTTSTNAITGSWSPAINNTTTTTYTFTPNAGQCALTTTLSINITAQTTPTFTQLAPYCEDDAVPNLATTSNNGISGNWSPAINNTTTTTYTFTPNAGQCATTTSMIITINPNISPSFTQVGPFCSGESISSIPTTSNNSITGTWSPTINNIATTTYTFTPNTGQCTLTTTMQIIVNDNLLPEFDPIGPYCYGNPITALPTNSNNGINGTWSPAIDNTTTTTYTFTPTVGQCATTAELDITIELLESEIISTTNQFCDAYGTAEVSGLNGTAPYSYIWPSTAGGINNGQANELIAGDYIVSLSDFHGCQTTQALTIEFTDNMNATAALNANPSCFEEQTGSINLSITNGTAPFNISWDSTSVETNSANYTVSYLFAGEYDFIITDINGCQANTNFELNDPPLLVATANYMQIACAGETAIVNISASGGTPSYSGVGSFETNSGTFPYTVTDSNGCSAITEVTVPEAPAPLEITANINDVTCYNENNGSINITPSGGTGPFYYSWSNEENTENITNLSPGTYSVEVTDYNGCTQSGAYSIVEPNSIDLTYTTNNLLCYDYADGSVEMYASGGITPYFYDIYNPRFSANGASHNNLAADTYTIRVSDAHGCTNSKSINILGPSELICAVSTTNPSCIGNNDGIIELYANGGTAPYSYVYEEMYFPTGIITGISEGIYNAQIIDANNCTKNINQISLFDNPVDCINIPNAFTPNADGINDTWLIDNIDMFPSAYIYVYNRWGQELYSTRGEGEPWSGKYMGKVVPTATYLYLINLYNGTKPYNGTVTIVY